MWLCVPRECGCVMSASKPSPGLPRVGNRGLAACKTLGIPRKLGKPDAFGPVALSCALAPYISAVADVPLIHQQSSTKSSKPEQPYSPRTGCGSQRLSHPNQSRVGRRSCRSGCRGLHAIDAKQSSERNSTMAAFDAPRGVGARRVSRSIMSSGPGGTNYQNFDPFEAADAGAENFRLTS